MTPLTLKSYPQTARDSLSASAPTAQCKGSVLAFGEQVGRPYNPERWACKTEGHSLFGKIT